MHLDSSPKLCAMATTHNQPLLTAPHKSASHVKTLCLFLSVVALVSSTALIASNLTRQISPHVSLTHHMCRRAHEPASCMALVSEVVQDSALRSEYRAILLHAFLEKTATHIQKAKLATSAVKYRINDPTQQIALADCEELLSLSVDRVLDSIAALQNASMESHEDAHAWLSAVLTNHATCLDGLEGSALLLMETRLKDLISRARTSLAIFVAISPPKSEHIESLNREFPSWLSREDRKLLQLPAKDIKANVIVAQDGTGKFRTVKEAVDFAPVNSKTRFVIYIKKGTYKENVQIGKTKKNLMIVGDGMASTLITGSLNVVDGATTFQSATVAAVGDGFIAQDIWFQNTAGPQKHQAVALRVGADQSVINRCKIDAYQDTLYAHSLRQFYRDSFITGTVDFIFGNAAVVFQNCNLVARKPLSNQNNMVTAQGREDPNQNTGTSIQNCNIQPSSDLQPVKGSIKTYLGRPWKQYSRTMVMQSFIDNHIDPSGWSPWDGDFALKTLYYAEYMNRGPGAGTSKRVNWPGYHVITNPEDAKKFTVAELIQGGVWLKSTGVAFTEGL